LVRGKTIPARCGRVDSKLRENTENGEEPYQVDGMTQPRVFRIFVLCISIIASSAPAQNRVVEPARETPVIAEADVVVVGGGLSGVGAAIGAARGGAKTIVIERTGYLGGWLRGTGLGNVLAIHDWRPALNEGALLDITRKVVELGAEGYPDLETSLKRGQLEVTNHELMPHAFQSLVTEAGAEILYFSNYAGSIVKSGRIEAAIIETPTGRAAVRGKFFIDCTGLATVAAESGSPVIKREAVMGLASWIGGVDVARFNAYEASVPKEPDPAARKWLEAKVGYPITDFEPGEPGPMDYHWGVWLERYGNVLGPKFREAVDKGEMPLMFKVGETGRVGLIEGLKVYQSEITGGIARPRTYIVGVDPTDIRQLSEAHIKSTVYLFKFTEFLRKNIPGFEKAQLTRIAEMTLNRGGRFIDGEFPAPSTAGEIEQAVSHRDAIALYQRGTDKGVYEVPYHSMLPERVTNLLAVGKSSAGGVRFRTHMLSVVMGQAAGIAGSIAVKDGVSAKDVSIDKLQAELRKAGVPIPQK
jgi:hypothetical protein